MPSLRPSRLLRRTTRLAHSLLAGLLCACGSGGDAPPPPPAASATQSTVVPSASNSVADGSTQVVLTIRVLDAAGNPLEAWPVSVTAGGTNNTIGQPAATDAAGYTTATITSTIAESKSISVIAGSGLSAVTLDSTPTIEFEADASNLSASLSTIEATPAGGLAADGSASSTITVTVRDANGNLVPGRNVLVLASGTGNAVTQPAALTDAAGSTSGAITSTLAQLKSLTAVIDPGGATVVLSNSVSVEFLADPSNISVVLSTISATPNSGVVANGLDTAAITVTVIDGTGNPVPGRTVALSASGNGNTLVQPAAVTDANGVATGSLATTVAESKSITVTVNPGTDDLVLVSQATVEFIGDAAAIDAGLSSASASPSSALIADGVAASVITTIVRDVNGNAVPGVAVSLSCDGTGNSLTQPVGVTDSDGTLVGSLASTVAELKTLTVTAEPGASAVELSDHPTVAMIGDPSTIDAALSSVSATPSAGIVADGVDSSVISVTVRDVNGNAVVGRTVVISVSGTDNTVTQPAALTDASGTTSGSIASTSAESKTVSVIVDPGPSQVTLDTQPVLQFVGDANNVSASLSTVDVAPRWRVAADGIAAIRVDVVVFDVFGNPVAGVPLLVQSTGAGNDFSAASATDASGATFVDFRSTVAEEKTITVITNPGPSQTTLDDEEVVSFTWQSTGKKYVRAAGSDSNSGESPADAWLTIDHAASVATAGTTVFVGAGNYFESVALANDGTASDPIHFLADSTGDLTGDAGPVVIDGVGANDVVVITGDYVILEGFEIRGASPSGSEGAGVRVGDTPTEGVILRKNLIYGNRRGISAKKARGLILEDNVISNSAATSTIAALGGAEGGEGVFLSNSREITVLNNLIYNNESIGLQVTAGSTDVLLRANTLYYNGDDQIKVGGLLNSVVVRDNIASEGFRAGIALSLGSLLSSTYNISWGNSLSDFLGLLLGLGDTSQDPLFLDPAGLDALLGGGEGQDDDFRIDVSGPNPALDSGSTVATGVTFTDGTSLADRSTRTDGVLDGTGADAATLNRGFHYPAQTDDLSELTAGDVRVHFGVAGSRRSQVCTRGASIWGAAGAALPTSDAVRWIELVASRIEDGEELSLIQAEVGSATELSLLRWSGTRWSEDWTATGVDAADAATRTADLATLALGDALAVWSDGTANPRFRRYTKGDWTDAEPVFASAPGASPIAWITLVGNSNGTEATLLFADQASVLRAVRWDGAAWDEVNVATLEAALRSIATQSFDAAYEASTGNLLACWAGPGGAARYAVRSSGSASWSSAASLPGIVTTPAVIDLAADDASARIAFAGLGDAAGGEDLCVGVWDGSTWNDVIALESGPGVTRGATAGEMNIAAGWSPASSEALVVYADDATGALHSASWFDGAGWTLAPDVPVIGMGFTQSVRLAAADTGAIAIVSDVGGQLHAFGYDGANWAADASLSSALPSSGGTAFDLFVER